MENKNSKEELTVFEVFGVFSKLWKRGEYAFLKLVLFCIKQTIPLVLLLLIGVSLAYFTSETSSKVNRSFIVSSTAYNGEFLSQSLEEIGRKLAGNENALKQKLSVEQIDFSGLSIDVMAIYDRDANMVRDELIYFEYLTDNRLVDKEEKKRIFDYSNHKYEVKMQYPSTVDGLQLMETILQYLRQDPYAQQMHLAALKDIETQLASNYRMLHGLDAYVEKIGQSTTDIKSSEDSRGIILESNSSADIGTMLFARMDMQKQTHYLTAKKVQLNENFRLLVKGEEFSVSTSILKNKKLQYPVYLIFGYLLVLFIITSIRKALALKEELKREEG